jgi:hypothetical protein
MKLVTVNNGLQRAVWKLGGTDLKKEASNAAAYKDKGSFHIR